MRVSVLMVMTCGLLLAGCGGSGSSEAEKAPPPPATKAQMVAVMDSACAALDRAGDADSTPQQTAQVLESEAVQEKLGRLEEIKPQARYARGYANFRDDVGQIVDAFINSTAKTRDEQTTLLLSLIGPGQRVSEFAKKVGAKQCD